MGNIKQINIKKRTYYLFNDIINIKNLKVGLSFSKKNCVICFIDSPLKIMKNAFYFILKPLFVLKIFKFCHDFLVI